MAWRYGSARSGRCAWSWKDDLLERGDLVGPYRVEAHVASGTMGEVYRVRHLQRDTVHALKFLPLADQASKARLRREAEALSRLSHPNVVTLTELLEHRGDPGLVMEWVDGPTLATWLTREHALQEVEALFTDLVRGLAHAHRRGLVHRDLKPANILLASTPDGLVPKVADFGLARLIDPGDARGGLTRTDLALGAAPYLAPEQVTDPRLVDARADIFSLGCLLFEMLFSRRAFDGPDPLTVMNKVQRGEWVLPAQAGALPERVVRALQGCLQVDREKRFQSCERLLETLAEGAARTQVSPPTRIAAPSAPQPVRLALWGALLTLIGVAGALLWWIR